MPSVVTLTTDFGTREYFVGAMKGAVLAVNPDVRLVDITHQVAAHDILEGAFTIRAASFTFPKGSVHLVVVDPGVGSSRRAIAVSAGGHFFVGPDNGVFTWIYQVEPQHEVYGIELDRYFRRPVSPTFHGRDIFAPVAGWISLGTGVSGLGPRIVDPVRLSIPSPAPAGERGLKGAVLHVDRFGNLITNLSPESLGGRPVRFEVAGTTIESIVECYSQATLDQPFALLGSAGLYEISVREASAALILPAKRGTEVAAYW